MEGPVCFSCGALRASNFGGFTPLPRLDPKRASHLLNSNDAPVDYEYTQCHKFLAGYKSHVSELDSKMRHLEDLVAKLKREREETLADAKVYEVIMNPVRRVPPELWSEIFLFCAKEDLAGFNGCAWTPSKAISSLDPLAPPWTLARVSSHWRAIATSFPDLWTQVSLVILKRDSTSSRRCRALAFFLNLQLRRAAPKFLSVTLMCEMETNGLTQIVVELLLASSAVWKELTVLLQPSSYEILDQLEGSLPNLTKVVLPSADAPAAPTTFLRFSPSLRTLICTARTFHRLEAFLSHVTNLKNPLYNLVNWGSLPPSMLPLYQSSADVRTHLQMFGKLPGLQECDIPCLFLRDPPVLTGRLVLQALTILRLTIATSEGVSQLLRAITLPRLSVFSLVSQSVDVSCLLNTFSQSNYQLDILTLHTYGEEDQALTTEECLKILAPLKSLRRLHIRSDNVRNLVLVDKLVGSSSSTPSRLSQSSSPGSRHSRHSSVQEVFLPSLSILELSKGMTTSNINNLDRDAEPSMIDRLGHCRPGLQVSLRSSS